MSWQGRILAIHRDRIILAHQQAWQEIEARAPIATLNYQAENDRLGYILVELWQAQTPDGELVALAITPLMPSSPAKHGLTRQGSSGTLSIQLLEHFRASLNRGNALSLCFNAFSSGEPVSTSLENALDQAGYRIRSDDLALCSRIGFVESCNPLFGPVR